MTATGRSFAFPVDDNFAASLQAELAPLRQADERICVVAIIGQGRLSRCHSKGSLASAVLGRECLRGLPLVTNPQHVSIHGFVDAAQRVIYLHLVSARDASCLAQMCADFLEKGKDAATAVDAKSDSKSEDPALERDFHSLLAAADAHAARALLFLFSLSHLIVVNNPGSRFDVSLIRLFRTLDIIRGKLQPSITELLRSYTGVSKEWMYAGRPCAPRLLFVFERNPLKGHSVPEVQKSGSAASGLSTSSIHNRGSNNNNEHHDEEDHENLHRQSSAATTDSIKRLQHNIEDQIYRLLRKARVITNISNNSLFAVPANEEFVYIIRDASETTTNENQVIENPMSFLLEKLAASCNVNDSSSKASKSSASLSSSSSSSTQNWSAASSSSSSSLRPTLNQSKKEASTPDHQSLKDFIKKHIDQALTRGFDDNLGRNPVPALFELPFCTTWFEVASGLYSFFLGDAATTKALSGYSALKSLLDVDMKFSDARCSKVVPLAITAYQEGLISHYTESFHSKRVKAAKAVFDAHARGPAYQRFLIQVKDECDAIWKDGRQSCEAMTLTGNHCIHALHRIPNDDVTDANQDLPSKPHHTLNKTLAASNCGTRQASREDPFDIRAANYAFYAGLDEGIYDEFKLLLVQKKSAPVARKQSSGSLKHDAVSSLSARGDETPGDASGGDLGQGAEGRGSSKTLATSHDDASAVTTTTTTMEDKTASSLGSGSPFTAEESLDKDEDDWTSQKGDREWTQDRGSASRDANVGREDGVAAVSPDEDDAKEIDGIEEIVVGDANVSSGLTDLETGNPLLQTANAILDTGNPLLQTANAILDTASAGLVTFIDKDEAEDEAKGNIGAETDKADATKQDGYDDDASLPVVLKGMMTLTSPPGSSVEFPSWSLIRIGNAGSYNAGKGLDQPGFLTGSNFLLPWDIPVSPKSSTSISAGAKGKMSKGYLRQKKNLAVATPKEPEASSVRAYVGYEYECPRGHRFISSCPDSASSNSSPAEKLLATDMPLYTLCPCRDRSTKVFIAQLMRIFVVTPTPSPPSLVAIRLSPRVQPAPAPCPLFHPGHCDEQTGGASDAIPLEPNCVWVLRLPYIYTDEVKVYHQPKDVAVFPSCRVLKGVLEVVEGGEG